MIIKTIKIKKKNKQQNKHESNETCAVFTRVEYFFTCFIGAIFVVLLDRKQDHMLWMEKLENLFKLLHVRAVLKPLATLSASELIAVQASRQQAFGQ